jgi:hypothetical protein
MLEKDGEDHLDRSGVEEEVLHRVKEDKNILHMIKKRTNANCIGHILLRNCLLKQVIEGKIERERRRRKQLLDLTKTRGY